MPLICVFGWSYTVTLYWHSCFCWNLTLEVFCKNVWFLIPLINNFLHTESHFFCLIFLLSTSAHQWLKNECKIMFFFCTVQNKPRHFGGRDQRVRASDHRVPSWTGQTSDPSTSAETGPTGPPQVLSLQGQTHVSSSHHWRESYLLMSRKCFQAYTVCVYLFELY